MKIYSVKPIRRNVRNKVMVVLAVFIISCMSWSIWTIIDSSNNSEYPDDATIEKMRQEELSKADLRVLIYDEETGDYIINTKRNEINSKYDAMKIKAKNSKQDLSASDAYGYIVGLFTIIVTLVKGRCTSDNKDDNMFVKTDDGSLYYFTTHNPQNTFRDTMFGYKLRKFPPKVTQNDLNVCRMAMQSPNIEKYLPKDLDTIRVHKLTKNVHINVCRIDEVEELTRQGGSTYFTFRTAQNYDMKLYGASFSYMNDYKELSEELKKRVKFTMA